MLFISVYPNLRWHGNADKSQFMLFSNSKKPPSHLLKISTGHGTDIEMVTKYKYLGIIINQNLSFQPHTANLVSKMFLLQKQILFLHPGEETLDFRNFCFYHYWITVICSLWMHLTGVKGSWTLFTIVLYVLSLAMEVSNTTAHCMLLLNYPL